MLSGRRKEKSMEPSSRSQEHTATANASIMPIVVAVSGKRGFWTECLNLLQFSRYEVWFKSLLTSWTSIIWFGLWEVNTTHIRIYKMVGKGMKELKNVSNCTCSTPCKIQNRKWKMKDSEWFYLRNNIGQFRASKSRGILQWGNKKHGKDVSKERDNTIIQLSMTSYSTNRAVIEIQKCCVNYSGTRLLVGK